MWLSQQGPHHPKHTKLAHPVITCILHYVIVVWSVFWVHDHYFFSQLKNVYSADHQQHHEYSSRNNSLGNHRFWIAIFLGIYSIWLLGWRLYINRNKGLVHQLCVIYQYTFLCNVTLVVSCLSLLTARPILATSFCIAVGIDQLLWYIDWAGYFLFNKFPIGVAKYILNESWESRLTCTHHLWTIPAVLVAAGGVHSLSLPLSGVIVIVNVLLSRWMTPSHVCYKGKQVYLNVNLSHELWKDINIGILQISKDKPAAPIYLFRLIWRWLVFNSMVFAVLYHVAHPIFGDAPAC